MYHLHNGLLHQAVDKALYLSLGWLLSYDAPVRFQGRETGKLEYLGWNQVYYLDRCYYQGIFCVGSEYLDYLTLGHSTFQLVSLPIYLLHQFSLAIA